MNLLPWRRVEQARLKKQFYWVLSGSLVCSAGLLIGSNTRLSWCIDDLDNQNKAWHQQISRHAKRVRTLHSLQERLNQLTRRQAVLKAMQANPGLMRQMLDGLASMLPDEVFLTGLHQHGQQVILNGYGRSEAAVFKLMRNLQANPGIKKPLLQEIKKTTPVYAAYETYFKIQFNQGTPAQ